MREHAGDPRAPGERLEVLELVLKAGHLVRVRVRVRARARARVRVKGRKG